MDDNSSNPLSQRPGASTDDNSDALQRAALLGFLVAVVMAAAWAFASWLLGRQFAIMAVAVGYFVGSAVRHFGKHPTRTLGLVAGLLSAVGIALGNAIVSRLLGPPDLSPLSIVFYAAAVIAAYSQATRPGPARRARPG